MSRLRSSGLILEGYVCLGRGVHCTIEWNGEETPGQSEMILHNLGQFGTWVSIERVQVSYGLFTMTMSD